MNKLEEICATKRGEVAERRKRLERQELSDRIVAASPPRGFAKALERMASTHGFGLIAEIKKASPSKGLIRHDFHPAEHAMAYERGGAACLSVLTDVQYFQGSDDYLVAARQATTLPVLRKDFVVDAWQIEESRALGADAVLLIVAVLSDDELEAFENRAIELGLDVLVEVHDEREMERALALKTPLLGVNNRDLRSFTTDLKTTERLAELLPSDRLLISESGITTHADCQRLCKAGAKAFLVGESFMRADDVERATRTLLHG